MAYTLKLNGDKVKGLSIMTNNGLQDVKTVKQGNDVLWEMEKVATPVISCSNNVVTMTCSTAGATIKYSTNGGSSYSTYSSPITISSTTTYTVYATNSGMLDSETTTYTATYVKPKLAKATVTCTAITQDRITLSFSHSAGSGVTYYVNYGATSSVSNPTTSSYLSKLTGSGSTSSASTYFQVQGTYKYIKVLATKSGYTNSDILSYKYTYPSKTPTTF